MKLACRLDNRSPDVLDEGDGDSDLLELVGDITLTSIDDRGVCPSSEDVFRNISGRSDDRGGG